MNTEINKFRDFSKKINYRKVFLKRYDKGLNQHMFGFKKEFYDSEKNQEKYSMIKSVLDNSIININKISESKLNLKLYFLGILIGSIASLSSLYFQSIIIFWIVTSVLILIGIYVIFIWNKKNSEAQVNYWMFLKSVEELKQIGVDYIKRK